MKIWREIEADAGGFVDDDTVDGTVRNLHRWLVLDPDGYAVMSARAQGAFVAVTHQNAAYTAVTSQESMRPTDQDVAC